MAVELVVYFDKTQQEHEQQVNALPAAGYRLITLDLYGPVDAQPDQVRYVATWIKRPGGPAQSFFQGLTRDQLTAKQAEQNALGNRPALLAASGDEDHAVFAVVYEPLDPIVNRTASFGMGGSLFQWESSQARAGRRMPRSVSVYGGYSFPMYAVIWETAPSAWGWTSTFDDKTGLYDWFNTHNEFQVRFEAWYNHGMRHSAVSVFPYDRDIDGHQFYAVFRDDFVGYRLLRHGWSKPVLEQDIRVQASANELYPISLSGGGPVNNPRFAAVLVRQEQPFERQFKSVGPDQAVLGNLDNIMKRYMEPSLASRQPDVRAGALAVVRDGKLMYAKGYTWAHPGYETTLPTSLFRLASCTKPLTAIAIFRLIEQGRLQLNTLLMSEIGDIVVRPDGRPPLDPRWNDITIDHLLAHAGGWNRNMDNPLPEEMASQQVFGAARPITQEQIVSMLADRNLMFAPGTESVYSNFGYMMLGLVIERITGLEYGEAMDQLVFRPLGLTRPRLGRSLFEQRHAGEVRYEAFQPSLGPSMRHQFNRPMVPEPYGGYSVEMYRSAGGYTASVVDYARVLAALISPAYPLLAQATVDTMWSIPPWTNYGVFRGWFPGYSTSGNVNWHNGYLPGTGTIVWRRDDRTGVAVLFNKNQWLYPYSEICNAINTELNAMNNNGTWPTQDLFPSFGLSSF